MRLSARGIEKSFGSTRALTGVDLQLSKGRILALLGENGAGKSTLLKVLAGAIAPDAGTMELDGAPYAPGDPQQARRAGVAVVHQELSVCPHLTVAENTLLGAEPHRFGFVRQADARARVQRALKPLMQGRPALSLTTLAAELSTAEQQLVEVARALAHDDCKLLVLDEPTSSLAGDDVERLFEVLRGLRERGLGIVYISHFLEEVRQIADDFVVLRDGAVVSQGRVSDVDNDQLVTDMAGREVHAAAHGQRSAGEPILALSGVAGVTRPKSASFELRCGEVLGIAGLVGSGRTELLRALFGLDELSAGRVTVRGQGGRANPRRRLRQGVGLLSEDRKGEGLAANLSIRENVTLSKLSSLSRFGLVRLERERTLVQEWIERLGIRCRDADQVVSELSGGNQQKVALARLLHHDVDVLLLDEPTRGIDVRSRGEIHGLIAELAGKGKAVLVVSSQLSELLQICDRIAVMHRGRLGPARPVEELSEQILLTEAVGA
jgi:ribose transport system ATP-binding protein